MSFKKIAVLFFILSVSQQIFAENDTIILQNGRDGYQGCRDSYTETLAPDRNNGDWRQLFTAN